MDKELTTGFIRSRYRDLEPLSSDEENKAYAQYISAAPATPLGHFEYSVTTAMTINNAPAGAKRAHFYNLGAGDIYWTDDGSTPTAGHGFPLKSDGWLLYDTDFPSNFKMVSTATSDVRVAYYG